MTGGGFIMADNKPASPAVSSQPVGIQIILDAEKEATKLVQQARKYRLDRLKEARIEAHREIESLKQEKQKQYQEYEQQLLEELEENRQKERTGVEQQLNETEKLAMEKNDQIIELLMEKVVHVDIKAPSSLHVSHSSHSFNNCDKKKISQNAENLKKK